VLPICVIILVLTLKMMMTVQKFMFINALLLYVVCVSLLWQWGNCQAASVGVDCWCYQEDSCLHVQWQKNCWITLNNIFKVHIAAVLQWSHDFCLVVSVVTGEGGMRFDDVVMYSNSLNTNSSARRACAGH